MALPPFMLVALASHDAMAARILAPPVRVPLRPPQGPEGLGLWGPEASGLVGRCEIGGETPDWRDAEDLRAKFMAQYPWNFLVGGAAGTVASIATYPLDTIR